MGKRILVIDEDKKTVSLFGKALEPRGIDVYAIDTPDKGIEKAIEIEPDLIFIDLIFKESNGLKVSKLIHAVEKLKKVPIVMLISHRSDLDPKYTATIGVVGTLVRPFTTDDIVATTMAIIGEEPGSADSAEIEAEPLTDEELEAFSMQDSQAAAGFTADDRDFVTEADKLIDQSILKHDRAKAEDRHAEPDVIHLKRPASPREELQEKKDLQSDEEIKMDDRNLFDDDEEEKKKDKPLKRSFDEERDDDEMHEQLSQASHEDMEEYEDDVTEEEKPGKKKKIMMVAAAVLIIAGLGVGAYQLKQTFFKETGKPAVAPAPSAPAVKEVVTESLPSSGQVKPAETAAPAPTPAVPAPQKEAKAVPPAAPVAPAAEKPKAAPPVKETARPKTEAAPKPAEKKEAKTKEAKKETAAMTGGAFKFSVQAGFFESEKNAESLVSSLKQKGYDAFSMKAEAGKKGVRVLIGKFDSSKMAAVQAKTLKEKEGLKVVIYHN
ncbi:MAG: response regulator [Nitrospirae bacterium]|nr:MAG: response regulator [Nitrospirota bacterium]